VFLAVFLAVSHILEFIIGDKESGIALLGTQKDDANSSLSGQADRGQEQERTKEGPGKIRGKSGGQGSALQNGH
jgi:hypothetical protein